MCRCSEPDVWNTLPYNLSTIAISQTRLGHSCQDTEGVDLLASAVISRMLEDFSVRQGDDDYSTKNFFTLIKQVRRYSVVLSAEDPERRQVLQQMEHIISDRTQGIASGRAGDLQALQSRRAIFVSKDPTYSQVEAVNWFPTSRHRPWPSVGG